MHQSIQLTSESELFVALCTYNMHSYVTLGVKNGETVKVLAAVGKVVDDVASECGFLFNDTNAIVQTEHFMFGQRKQNEVDYKAFAIDYQHYIEFLDYLKKISLQQQHRERLYAYCPDEKKTSHLTWQLVQTYASPSPTVATDMDTHRRIGLFGNSCRHSAVRLTRTASQQQDLGESVSSLFFKHLPLTAKFSGGCVQKSTPFFYILPPPPSAFADMEPKTLKIISRLYRRLDEIMLSQQDNPLTIQKFQKIKHLYQDLTRDSQLSLVDIMHGIETWENEHKSLIASHRTCHWFSFATATQTLFVDLHQEFNELRAHP